MPRALRPLLCLGLLLAGVSVVSAQQTPPVVPVQPPAGAWDVHPGVSIRIGFAEPMHTASVERNVTIDPVLDATVEWHLDDQELRFLPADPLQTNKRYTVRVGTGIRTQDGGALLEEPLIWQFTTGTATGQVRFSPGARIQTVTPAGSRGVPVQPGYPRIRLQATLHAISPQELARRYDVAAGSEDTDLAEGLLPVATWTAALDATAEPAEIQLPDNVSPGLYVMAVTHPVAGRAATAVVYSDYAVVSRAGTEGAAFWVATVPNGVPGAEAELSLIDGSGATLVQATADDEGLVLLDHIGAATMAVAEVDGQVTVTGLDSHHVSGPWSASGAVGTVFSDVKAHAHTDRPLYRPGHTVHFKATFARLTPSGFEPLAATDTVTVTVTDPRGQVVEESAHEPDSFGSLSGDMELAESAPTGTWTIRARSADRSTLIRFQVEEYVKPDFTVSVAPDQAHYVRGDTAVVTVKADYAFGAPVAGAVVEFIAMDRYRGVPIQERRGQTDANGIFTTTMSLVGSTSVSFDVMFQATVTDAMRRPVTADATATVHPAAFALGLSLDGTVFRATEPMKATVTVMDHGGGVVAGHEVMVEILRRHDEWVTEASRIVTTDSRGRADAIFSGLSGGPIRIRASAQDPGGREVRAVRNVYVHNTGGWSGQLSMTADQERYAPGDTAEILIRSPYTGTALLSLESITVHNQHVLEIGGETLHQIPIEPNHAPEVKAVLSVWVAQSAPRDRAEARLVQAAVELDVSADHRRIGIEVEADREQYEPGETATLTVVTTNGSGEATNAQLSVAVVDTSIFSLAPDASEDIFAAFWSDRAHTVVGYDTLQPSHWPVRTEREPGGGSVPGWPPNPTPMPTSPPRTPESPPPPPTDTPSAPQATPTLVSAPGDPPPAEGLRVRQDFLDTAFWASDIVTGDDGQAEVVVPLPDNLTTWVVLVRAVNQEAEAGQARHELLVTQPVIARPALPRFAVSGDTFALDVAASNHTAGILDAECTLETDGLVQLDPGSREFQLLPAFPASPRWTVVASDIGTARVTTTLQTSGRDDAVALPLTVHPFVVPERDFVSGSVTDSVSMPIDIPFNAVPAASEIEVRLASTAASGVLDGIGSLVRFPYGCVEQTMSKAYPNAVIARLLLELDLRDPALEAELQEVTEAAIQKLYDFQLPDGGWGWWQSSRNTYITAYVLHGLTLMQAAGFEVDDAVLDRGFDHLAAAAPSHQNANVRAYAAYVLAYGGRGDAELTLALFEDRSVVELDNFSRAALAIALHTLGQQAPTDQLLDELEELVVEDGDVAHWRIGASRPDWRTMPSDEKATAMALSALVTVRPDSPLIPKTVRWLMENRSGAGWRTTQATAFAILGLTDYIVVSGELWSEFDWQVGIDGRTVGEGQLTASNRQDRIPPIRISAEDLVPGSHTLDIQLSGQGVLYYSVVTHLERFQEGFSAADAAGMGLGLKRQYIPVTRDADLDDLSTGDLISVKLTLEVESEAHFVLIEDKLPAGLEAVNLGLEGSPSGDPRYTWHGYERVELRDDRVTFFATRLSAGRHHFEYPARAVTPGIFAVRPAEAYEMYRLESWARSASRRLIVAPSGLAPRPDLGGDVDGDCRVTAFDASMLADGWGGPGLDLTGDKRLDSRDIGRVLAGRGRVCGEDLPDLRGAQEPATLNVNGPEAVSAGEVFTVTLGLEGVADTAAFEAYLRAPAGFEVVGVSTGLGWLGGSALGPSELADGTIRVGGVALGDASEGGPAIRLTLRARDATPVELEVAAATAVSGQGEVHPVAWSGEVLPASMGPVPGTVYLPRVDQR